ADELDHADDAIEIAERSLRLGKQADGAQLRCSLAVLDAEASPELALVLGSVRAYRDLSGDEELIARDDEGYVIGSRGGRNRKRHAQLRQPLLNLACHLGLHEDAHALMAGPWPRIGPASSIPYRRANRPDPVSSWPGDRRMGLC